MRSLTHKHYIHTQTPHTHTNTTHTHTHWAYRFYMQIPILTAAAKILTPQVHQLTGLPYPYLT